MLVTLCYFRLLLFVIGLPVNCQDSPKHKKCLYWRRDKRHSDIDVKGFFVLVELLASFCVAFLVVVDVH